MKIVGLALIFGSNLSIEFKRTNIFRTATIERNYARTHSAKTEDF